MHRRQFVAIAALQSASAAILGFAHPEQARGDSIKLGGEFDFSFENGKLVVGAKDVVIDGLTIPKLTWGWIGLGVAQGLLSGLGGAIFAALANSVLGIGKSMSQLLQEQLLEIARILDEKLDDAALRAAQAKLEAYAVLYDEYLNDPKNAHRLDYLVNESAATLSILRSLGFKGYRSYMVAAGLRLALLQDLAKAGGEGAKKNFETQRNLASAHHSEIVKLIEKETHPQLYQDRWKAETAGLGFKMDNGFNINEMNILGERVTGRVMVRDGVALVPPSQSLRNMQEAIRRATHTLYTIDFIDWEALRAKIKSQNTDIGERMIARWKGANAA